LPRGGDAAWAHSPLLEVDDEVQTWEELHQALQAAVGDDTYEAYQQWYDLEGFSEEEFDESVRQWSNPLRSSLPAAGINYYCAYGVDNLAENGYTYGKKQTGGGVAEIISRDDKVRGLSRGVFEDHGDGTVPLDSLGAMLGLQGDQSDRWQRLSQKERDLLKRWTEDAKQAGANVHSWEFKHRPSTLFDASYWRHVGPVDAAVRGGPLTADHVDILGNWPLLENILKIATRPKEAQPLGDVLHTDIWDRAMALLRRVAFPSGTLPVATTTSTPSDNTNLEPLENLKTHL
ncbi:MAG: hypothetical protein MHM6MM_007539, partial [Cercozoa sp. M6MM]